MPRNGEEHREPVFFSSFASLLGSHTMPSMPTVDEIQSGVIAYGSLPSADVSRLSSPQRPTGGEIELIFLRSLLDEMIIRDGQSSGIPPSVVPPNVPQ